MNAEIWTMLAVGVALAGLQWRMYASMTGRMDRLEGRMDTLQRDVGQRLSDLDRRLARIEGWIAGRFREETAPSA